MSSLIVGKLYTIPDDILIDHFWKTNYSRTHKTKHMKLLLFVNLDSLGDYLSTYSFLCNDKIVYYGVMKNQSRAFETQFKLLR